MVIQDLPPTEATISGPSSGNVNALSAPFTVTLDKAAQYGGLTVNLSSTGGISGYLDTFQATSGGGNVESITIAAGSTTGTFYLTPAGPVGPRTISVTTSPTSTNSTPWTYTGNGISTAAGYTITMASGGYQNVPVTATIALTPANSVFNGTISATPGGGTGQCQVFQTFVTHWYSEQGPKTFTFTPLTQDSVTFTFTNSGTLANPAPTTYTATRVYLQDLFQLANGGPPIQSHTSSTLPSAVAGSTWSTPTGGSIYLDGNGGTYLASSGSSYTLSNATMPTASGIGPGGGAGTLPGVPCEFLFTVSRSNPPVSGSDAEIVLLASPGEMFTARFYDDGHNGLFIYSQNGAPVIDGGSCSIMAAGTTWYIKIDLSVQSTGDNSTGFASYYSTDGINWNTLIKDAPNPWIINNTSLPVAVAAGLLYQGTVGTPTTGLHIGSLILQDIQPATPNCQISKAYVTTSGQMVAVFFSQISNGSPVIPSGLTYAPAIFQNGASIGALSIAWIASYHNMALLFMPTNPNTGQPYTINPGDAVTISAAQSWMACGTANAATAVTHMPLLNFSSQSSFGTNTLVKTLRPGYNISDFGSSDSSLFSCFANLRYRLQPMLYSLSTVDGYPTSMYSNPGYTAFASEPPNPANDIDSTGYAGFQPGLYAVRWDDLSYTTSPTILAICPQGTGGTVVTPMPQYNNPGRAGTGSQSGQRLGIVSVFQVTRAPARRRRACRCISSGPTRLKRRRSRTCGYSGQTTSRPVHPQLLIPQIRFAWLGDSLIGSRTALGHSALWTVLSV